jgi:hypothetical protein
MQDDAHSPLLTVRETLQFAAMLRMRITSPAKVAKNVTEIMRLLSIEDIANTFIGSEETADQRTISRGQLRRVTIGCEIIDSASLVFLDEVYPLLSPLPSLPSLSCSSTSLPSLLPSSSLPPPPCPPPSCSSVANLWSGFLSRLNDCGYSRHSCLYWSHSPLHNPSTFSNSLPTISNSYASLQRLSRLCWTCLQLWSSL